MAFDYSNLLGRIKEKCGNQYRFAEEMGISKQCLSLRVNNKVAWKQTEISKACEILDILPNDISKFFFKI